jgi:uncharacterized membrane protein
MSLYEALKAIHIMAIAIWVGAAFLQLILAIRADETRRLTVLEDAEFTGTRLFPPAAGLALLTGIAMVIDSDGVGFGDLWVILALAGWVLSLILGAVFIDRSVKEAAGGEAAAYGRILALARIDLLILLLVIVDMVVKPS